MTTTTHALTGLALALTALLALNAAGVHAAPAFAAYLVTMEPDNTILVFAGAADGTLTPAATPSVSAHGTGYSTGNVQSQGAAAVVGDYLFVANPGSGTIAQFAITAADPTVLTFVATASTGGDWPNAVGGYSAGSGAGDRNVVCATNSGASSGVRCFTFTASGMTAISGGDRSWNTTLTTPPVSHTGPSEIAFNAAGTAFVVINKSPPTPFYPPYLLYTVDTTTNVPAAAPAASPAIGAVNFAGVWDPQDGAFVVVDAGAGLNVLTLALGSGAGAGASVTPLSAYFDLGAGVQAPCWVARSAQNSHFYTANTASKSLTEVSRTISGSGASASATLAVVRQIPVGLSMTEMTVVSLQSPAQDYLLLNAGGAQTIVAFRLTAADSTTGPLNYQNVTAATTSHHAAGLASYVTKTPNSATAAARVSAAVAVAMAVVVVALALRV